MKVLCDVCERHPASLMCCADEAALCVECDRKIHAANKLANKHERVSLLAAPELPSCDICQEKRAFFFCVEDRALLCRCCDFSIHSANSLSCNHKRFLMTGTRIPLDPLKEEPVEPSTPDLQSSLSSPTSALQGPYSSTQYGSSKVVAVSGAPSGPICTPGHQFYSGMSQGVTEHKVIQEVRAPKFNDALPTPQSLMFTSLGGDSQNACLPRKSSISEFLTDSVPGWRVEELLNLSDLADGFTMNDVSSAKVDCMTMGDFDWTAPLSLFEEQMFADAFHEVPQVPPTLTPVTPSKTIRSTRALKGLSKLDSFLTSSFDDAFIVPDLRISAAPLVEASAKRRRCAQGNAA